MGYKEWSKESERTNRRGVAEGKEAQECQATNSSGVRGSLEKKNNRFFSSFLTFSGI